MEFYEKDKTTNMLILLLKSKTKLHLMCRPNNISIKNELPDPQCSEERMQGDNETDGEIAFMGCSVDQNKQVIRLHCLLYGNCILFLVGIEESRKKDCRLHAKT